MVYPAFLTGAEVRNSFLLHSACPRFHLMGYSN